MQFSKNIDKQIIQYVGKKMENDDYIKLSIDYKPLLYCGKVENLLERQLWGKQKCPYQ